MNTCDDPCIMHRCTMSCFLNPLWRYLFLKGAQLIMHSIRLVVVSTLAVQMRKQAAGLDGSSTVLAETKTYAFKCAP